MIAKTILFVKKYQKDIILVIGVVLISLFSFAAGYIVSSSRQNQPIIIENEL